MDHAPSIELLTGTHEFPCIYQFKAIGSLRAGFEAGVVAAVSAEVGPSVTVEHSVRTTPSGRHVAVTLHVNVQTPEQVRSIYARIKELDGLHYLL